jgi:adenylosuccinate synthase
MPNLAVVGGQWGDEGKGKVVDLLAPRFSIVARYQGGPNAGHTVVFDGQRFALHHIPSGIFHEGVQSVIGPGMLIDPDRLLEEIEGLTSRGIPVAQRLAISTRAHVILPLHREIDGAIEKTWGRGAIGTTKRGIGPAYAAKAQRWGLRICDLADGDAVRERFDRLVASGFGSWLHHLGLDTPSSTQIVDLAARWWEALSGMCADTTAILHEALGRGRSILFEGAQGALLDIDHGTYPFVTSSSTTTAGIAPGLGVPPRAIDAAVGVFKAYLTRVGSGPFPTEIEGDLADSLREAGGEFGTTTGRPRRCGWFDAVAARFAVDINGLDEIALTKFDVLSGVEQVRVCVAYEIDGERSNSLPPTVAGLGRVRPVFEDFEGWQQELSGIGSVAGLPAAARRVLDRLEQLCGCPIGLVSVGPDRTEAMMPRDSLLGELLSR